MRFVFPYYGRYSGIKHTPEGNFCRKSGRILHGHTRLFFDVLSPTDYMSICKCAKCGRLGKTVKSTEFYWSWLSDRVRPMRDNFDLERFERRCDASFCRRCFLAIQREFQTLRRLDEIDSITRQINGVIKNGSNKDNRTASPVSR